MRQADDAIVMPAGELGTFRRRHERDLSNNLDTNEREVISVPVLPISRNRGKSE